MAKKALGIDLGTSNTCVAILEKGKAKIIPDERGNPYTPSYLTILGEDKCLVGYLAKVQAISNPHQTAYSVKRLMGRGFNDAKVQEMKDRVSYKIVAGPSNEAAVEISDRVLTPVDVSAYYLKTMYEIANHYLGTQDVIDVIITVPAYFNDLQRTATIEAGEKAGLNVLRLINEPTAAALAYGFRKDVDERIAIYDLGGGTFDISILEVNHGVFDVLGTHGDSFLGGNDFDHRIVDYVLKDFSEVHGFDLSLDKMALQRVRDACENAKCELSSRDSAQVNLPFIAKGDQGAINLDKEITKSQFQEMTQDLIERSIEICQKVLDECGVTVDQLDGVILVGGQTRMPLVQKAVTKFFGKQPLKGIHPDEAVALGAAIQAGMLEEKGKEVLLLDVTPLNLGLQSVGDLFSKIIPKNAKVPISVSKIFTTSQDDQERVKIVVMQGQEKKASKNTLLGDFILEGIRPAPRMEPQIQVTFRIDRNGILNVRAQDAETGQMQQISIQNRWGQSLPAAETLQSGVIVESEEEEESMEIAVRE